MKKTLLLLPLFILALTFVSADNLYIQSDNSTEYYDGANWQPAVNVADISAWNSITIPATWIWNSELTSTPESVDFRKEFYLKCDDVDSAILTITADNYYNVSLNGVPIALDNSDGNWMDVETYDISSNLFEDGFNTLDISATNFEGGSFNPAGLIYTLDIDYDCNSGGNNDVITPSAVTGTVTYANGSFVVDAYVDVTCNDAIESTTTNEFGDYYVLFTSDVCGYGSPVSVTATKDDVSGTNTGFTCESAEDCEIPVALVDVTIPEFGVIAGAIALVAGLGIIAYRRK